MGQLADFCAGVGRTAGETHFRQHRHIWVVVAHVSNVGRRQFPSVKGLFKRFHFVTLSEVDVLNAQAFETFEHAVAFSARNDGDGIALFYRVLQCVAVFDVHGSEHVAVFGDQYLTVGEHPVYIENKGFNLFELFNEIVRHGIDLVGTIHVVGGNDDEVTGTHIVGFKSGNIVLQTRRNGDDF